MKMFGLALSLLLSLQSAVAACPACAVSSPQNNFWQTFWALSVMGFLPLVLFVLVGLIIVRIQKNEQKTIAHS